MLKRNLNDNICLEHSNAKKSRYLIQESSELTPELCGSMWSKYNFITFDMVIFFGVCIAKCDQSQLIVTTNLFIWQQKKTNNNNDIDNNDNNLPICEQFKCELTTDGNCKFVYFCIVLDVVRHFCYQHDSLHNF